ncbi:hypothetical protein C8J57DRAFT_1434915 [Mycena rebaudengoi]|nr:hypothetical protein C8J57DRAFT_1434915 [Mycena rebaudengoi]
MSAFVVSPAVQHRDIPIQALCDEHTGKRVTVGVAIEAYPNMYELPGGNWEAADSTILHTVAREALEETGLVVTRIAKEFPGFEYSTRRGPAQQLNFIVDVKGTEGGGLPKPTLNPEEHQAFAWVGPGDSVDNNPTSESMAKVVQSALQEMMEGEW